MKKLKLFSTVYHYGENENSDKQYKVTITGFDRLAIQVRGESGDTYFLNLWELTDENGKFFI
mgnify:CR=1 FL=1